MKEKWKNQKNQKSFDGDCCTKDDFKKSAKNFGSIIGRRIGREHLRIFLKSFQENEYFKSDHKKSILCETKIMVTRRYNRPGLHGLLPPHPRTARLHVWTVMIVQKR